MFRWCVAAVVAAVLGGPTVVAKPADPGEFLVRAITDGLTADGVSRDLAARLARNDDFIKKCKLCNLTQHALATYAEQPGQPAAESGKGLKAEFVAKLKSEDAMVRQAALRSLVDRYVTRGFERRNVSKEARRQLLADFQEMRQAAMPALPDGQKFCPSCDGACQVRPREI
jgi:hypothetical protein